MPSPMPMPHPHGGLIDTIQNCETTCEHMTHHILHMENCAMRKRQLELLRDCADICTLTAKYIARMSLVAKCTANLCAYVCEACANECMRFPDMHSQHCAQVCMHCAMECRAFAM